MTRGRYLELDEFGEYLAHRTDVTLVDSDELVRFQLNDQRNSDGGTEYVSYEPVNQDMPEIEDDVVAMIVEGVSDHWEKLLEQDASSKVSSLTDSYNVEELDGDKYIVSRDY